MYDTLVNLVASRKDYIFRPYPTAYFLQCQSKVVFPIYPIPTSFLYTVNPVLWDLTRGQRNMVAQGGWSLNTGLINMKYTMKGNKNYGSKLLLDIDGH